MQKITIAAAILLLASCKSNEIGNSKDVNPDAIYQEYNVTATEGENEASFTAQFRFGGDNGTTLVLNDKSQISFDGKALAVDSSGGIGAYYQTKLPMASAAGKHNWTFTDGNDKSYSNTFNLQPFTLVTNFAAPITAADLELNFSGLQDNDEINISINDTSHSSSRYRDVDTAIKISGGKTIISAMAMKKLAPGPLTIDVTKIQNINLKEATKEGGSIMYSFQLQTRKATLKK
jgi:hypothetical protein